MKTKARKRAMSLFLAPLLALGLAREVSAQAPGNPPPHYALTNARIVTVSGGVIEGGTVVVSNGLIAAVGKDVKIPPEAWVIDAKGLTVYPGLIDALTDVGLSAAPAAAPAGGGPGQQAQQQQQQQRPPSQGPEDRPGTTPWRTAADEIAPADRRIEQWRNAGFTTVMAMPRTGIFPGRGSLLNLSGGRPGEMVVQRFAALGITTQSPGGFTGFPGSLMGTISYIKQLFLDAAHAREAEATYAANPRGLPRPPYDRATYVLNSVLRGGQPVLLPASASTQITRMIALGQQINATQQEKAKWILYGAQQAYEAADAIAAAKLPVIVGLRWPERDREADPEAEESLWTLRHRDKAPSSPAALERAGVKFAFSSDGITSPRDILRNAKKAIDAGLKPEAALRAFTLSAAEIYGVADRLGSIEPGKIANLVVADGDLFNDRTRIKWVFVDGRKFDVPEQPAAPEPTRGAGPPAAANLSGRWNITVTTPDGPVESTAEITQSPDGSLRGSINTMFGTALLQKASITGNRFTFTITLDIGNGPQEFTFSGTAEGNSIKGTVSFGETALEFTGTRPGAGSEIVESDAEVVR